MTDETQKENIKLSEIIDLNVLQKFQDTFANSMNVASLTVDIEGAVTQPSNFTDFCFKHTRGSKLGCQRCDKCDITGGKLAAEKGEPVIYNCHAGLTDFAVPILLNGKHIGSILGGQVLTHEPDEQHFRKLAKEFGINEDEYIAAIKKIKIIPYEQVEAAAQLLYVVANSISEMALKNFELIRSSNKEKFLNKIVETIRDTSDIEETLTFICEEMAKLFNVQRVIIAEFLNPETCSVFRVKKEYKTQVSHNSLDIENRDKMTAQYWSESLFEGLDVLAVDNIEQSNTPDYFKKSYKKIGVKSAIGASIKKDNGKWGLVVLSDYEKQRVWTEYEINFIRMISNQIYISIKQAELNLENQKQAEREVLLRKIIENIRSSLDMDKTLHFICKEVAKLLNVQRATIVQFPNSKNYEIYTVRTEYKTNIELKGLTSSEYKVKAAGYWGRNLASGSEILAFNNIQESDTPHYFKQCYNDLGVKSMIGLPIKKEGNQWGTLVLSEYNEYRDWTEDEINLLKTISNQIYIAIEQAELYSKTKQQIQRQSILRQTIDVLRSTLDAEEIKKRVVEIIGNYFDADRCLFDDYDNETNKFLPFRIEKLKSNQITSLVGCEVEKDFPEFLARLKKGKNIIIKDLEKTLSKKKLISYKTLQTLTKSDVKSDYGLLVNYKDKTMGILIMHFVNKKRSLTHEEFDFLKILRDQIGTALYQAELYKTMQKAVENEKALRKIISSSVNKFDINEIINSMVTETGQLFQADRCFFIEFGTSADSMCPISHFAEYLSSPDIKSHTERLPSKQETAELIKESLEKGVAFSNDTSKHNVYDSAKKLIDNLNVKSFLCVPVIFGDDIYGSIVLHYVKSYKNFSQDEINLMNSIADQTAAVIHQANLYQQIEKNEKYTRTVLNSINDCIITIDNDFIIETCNPAIENIWGYTPIECVGQPLSLLLDYDCENQKKSLCLTHKSVYGIKKNGEEFPVEINLSNVITDDKKVILVVVRDITERKRIEQMKNEFVSTVSHELRTPLTSLRGSLGLIISGKMGDLSEKIKNLLDIANNNCTRLINLINDILDIEKIEAGKMDFDIKAFDLMPLIHQAIQLNLQFAQKFNVKINLVKALDTALVQIDSSRLIQVLTNLLSNAIKFSNPNSSVHVSVIRIDGVIQVSVTNYGTEIPQNFKNRIFQKFAQADSSDSRQKGGTGLGLSISKAILEKMDGNIGFTSENQKTIFYFNLPEIIESNKENIDE